MRLVDSQPSWGSAILLALLVVSLSRPARADGRDYHEEVEVRGPPKWLTLPVQVGHAAAWVPEQAGPIYKLGVSVLPGVRVLDRLEAHLVLEGLYRNPGWDVDTGVRLAFLMARCQTGLLPLNWVLEGSRLWKGDGWRLMTGPMLGLGTLASVNFLFGRETDRGEYVANMGIAIDVLSFWDPAAAVMHYVHHGDVFHGMQ